MKTELEIFTRRVKHVAISKGPELLGQLLTDGMVEITKAGIELGNKFSPKDKEQS